MRQLLIFSLILLTCGCSNSLQANVQGQVDSSDRPAHHTETGFTNPYLKESNKTFFSFMRMRYFSDQPWADHLKLAYQVPVTTLEPEVLKQAQQQPRISWLGHSSFLIQYQGLNLLTDPIFSDRASPVGFAGPERYVPHVIDYQQLPAIDLVIISHNHYDHLDQQTIEVLPASTQFAVPLGLKAWFVEAGVAADRITEFDWWQQHNIAGLQVTALPSQHWSARGLGDRFQTLWASWAINIEGLSLWFAGDTGYNPIQFKQIGQHFNGFDLALIPIGAYAPRWFMQDYHVNPEEAVQLHQDVRSKHSIGMHWGTFPLTAEEPGEPPLRLRAALKEAGIGESEFSTMMIGESKQLPHTKPQYQQEIVAAN